MARVTVEDCVTRVPNRFELVMLAGQRARDISAGAPLTLDRDNDKNPVVALREIADSTVDLDELRNALVRGLQKHVELEEPEEELTDLMTAEEIASLAAAEGAGEEERAAGESEADADEEAAEDELTSEEQDTDDEENGEDEEEEGPDEENA